MTPVTLPKAAGPPVESPQLLRSPLKSYANGAEAAPGPGWKFAVPCSVHSPPPGAAIDGAATIAPPTTAIAAPATRDSLPNLRMRAPSEFRRRAGSTDDRDKGSLGQKTAERSSGAQRTLRSNARFVGIYRAGFDVPDSAP